MLQGAGLAGGAGDESIRAAAGGSSKSSLSLDRGSKVPDSKDTRDGADAKIPWLSQSAGAAQPPAVSAEGGMGSSEQKQRAAETLTVQQAALQRVRSFGGAGGAAPPMVTVELRCARNIPNEGVQPNCNSFATIDGWGTDVVSTKVVVESLHPRWKQQFQIRLKQEGLTVRLFHQPVPDQAKNVLIGTVQISAASLIANNLSLDDWVDVVLEPPYAALVHLKQEKCGIRIIVSPDTSSPLAIKPGDHEGEGVEEAYTKAADEVYNSKQHLQSWLKTVKPPAEPPLGAAGGGGSALSSPPRHLKDGEDGGMPALKPRGTGEGGGKAKEFSHFSPPPAGATKAPPAPVVPTTSSKESKEPPPILARKGKDGSFKDSQQQQPASSPTAKSRDPAHAPPLGGASPEGAVRAGSPSGGAPTAAVSPPSKGKAPPLDLKGGVGGAVPPPKRESKKDLYDGASPPPPPFRPPLQRPLPAKT